MDQSYSIEDILSAVNDLQRKDKKVKKVITNFKKKEIDNSDIPTNTLKLIEEAEGNWN